MEKKKKWIILASVILVCVVVGISALAVVLIRGRQQGENPPDTGEDKPPVTSDDDVDVETFLTEGYFPANVLNKVAKPVYNNDLTNTTPSQELRKTGLRYTFGTTNALKSVYVDNIEMKASKYDTMTIRLRSLTEDEFTRFRLYLLTDKGGDLKNNQLIDTAGKNENLIKIGEADADGWMDVTVLVGSLQEWADAETIKGFNFGWVNKGTDQEISEIRFSWEDSKVLDAAAYDWTSGYFPADVLYQIASPIYSNDDKTTPNIRRELLSTSLKYSYNQLHINGLKAFYVDNLELEAARFDTMTVKLRSRDGDTFSRWRLYLVSDKDGDLKSDQVADSQSVPGMFEVSAADKDGWVTVNVDLTKVNRWINAKTIKAFSFGYVVAGPNQEIEYVRFQKRGAKGMDGTLVTDGRFPAKILYSNGYPVYSNNESLTRFIGESLEQTGVKYTWGAGYADGLKSVYVKNMQLSTEQFDTMTVRLRAIDKGEFKRFRLYLLTDTSGSLSDNVLGMVVDSDASNAPITVSKPDSNGWVTVKIDVSSTNMWKMSKTITAFNFGFVNSGLSQEIADIYFTKEKEETPVTVVTDGRFPADILYANGYPVWNNQASSTAKLKEELLSTGVKYDYTGQGAGSLKSVYVEHMALKTLDFNTMTVRLRSLDDKAFSRFRLYLLTDNGGSMSDNQTGMAVDSGSLNTDLITIGEADSDGFITVTIDVGSLELWKNANTITGFNFGYVNAGAQQEIAEILFTMKEKPTPDPDPVVTVVTDGKFPAGILYANGYPVWNNVASSTESLKEELLSTGVKYDYTGKGAGSLKSVYVESMELKTEEFNRMTVRIRSLNNTAFTRWRLYLLTDVGGSLSDNTAGMVLDSNNLNKELIMVGEADSDGFITVTIDVGSIELWKNSGVIKGFNFGYVNTGAQQEVAEILFTKEKEPDPTPDPEPEPEPEPEPDPDPELTEEEKLYVENGMFNAGVLYAAGRPLWNNETGDTDSKEELLSGSVKYTFKEGLALKSIYVKGIEMAAKDFNKVSVRLRSLTEDGFERFRLYLLSDAGGSLTAGPVLDTGKDLNSDLITIGEADLEGWMDVTIDLSGLAAWTQAGTVKGFAFGYVNEGSQQEIASIRFGKANGVFSKSAVYLYGRPVHNNQTASTTKVKETLTDTGVKYDFTGLGAGALKSVWLEDISLKAADYDTMTVKIRSLDNARFERWRLYLLTDTGGSLTDNNKGRVLDANASNSLVTIGNADADGWITVTIKVGNTALWKNAGTIKSINLGYVNRGNTQEIGEISFTNSKAADTTSLSGTAGALAGAVGSLSGRLGEILGMVAPVSLAMAALGGKWWKLS